MSNYVADALNIDCLEEAHPPSCVVGERLLQLAAFLRCSLWLSSYAVALCVRPRRKVPTKAFLDEIQRAKDRAKRAIDGNDLAAAEQAYSYVQAARGESRERSSNGQKKDGQKKITRRVTVSRRRAASPDAPCRVAAADGRTPGKHATHTQQEA